MLIATVVFHLFFSVMGFLCICLKEYKINAELWHRTKSFTVTGTITSILASLLILRPLHLSEFVISMLLGVQGAETIILYILFVRCAGSVKKASVCCITAPPQFYITGDKHRHFDTVKKFCKRMNTQRNDVLIILGDAGFNYYGDKRDDKLKSELSKLNITLFCIHGNKENRPQNIVTYGLRNFCGGKVLYEPKYPNINFAIDGEIYTFDGQKYMVVGGAHSVDKNRCLDEHKPFWEDEMPNDKTKRTVEDILKNENNQIFGMMTHTCPIQYIPTEMFMSTRQSQKSKMNLQKSKMSFKLDIDRTTEEWLGNIEKTLNYQVWFCGHYHIDKCIDKICMMFGNILPLHMAIGDG